MASGVFSLAMRSFVVFLNLMPLYLMNFEINEWLDNEVDRKMIKLIFNVISVLNQIAYFYGTFKRPKVIP